MYRTTTKSILQLLLEIKSIAIERQHTDVGRACNITKKFNQAPTPHKTSLKRAPSWTVDCLDFLVRVGTSCIRNKIHTS